MRHAPCFKALNLSPTSRRKPRILRFLSRIAIGGVQNGLIETLSRADREKFDFAVLCYKKAGVWAPRVEALGIPVYTQKALPVWDPYQILRLSRAIARIAPDLIHISMAPSVIVGATAARLAGVRRIVIQHNNLYDLHWEAQSGFLNCWEWALTRRADALIGVSDSVSRCTEARLGLPSGSVQSIPNGINLDRFRNPPPHDLHAELGLDPATPLVAKVARYLAVKRIEDFIDAAGIIGGQRFHPPGRPAPVFLVIGGGPDAFAEEYRRRADALREQADIRFLGGRSDLPSLLPHLNAAVLASDIEGCPNTILEYMACGLPIVATNIAPIAELVTDQKEALLAPPRSPGRLAEGIMRVLAAPELGRRLGAAAAERVQNFDWTVTQRAYEAVYARVLGL